MTHCKTHHFVIPTKSAQNKSNWETLCKLTGLCHLKNVYVMNQNQNWGMFQNKED